MVTSTSEADVYGTYTFSVHGYSTRGKLVSYNVVVRKGGQVRKSAVHIILYVCRPIGMLRTSSVECIYKRVCTSRQGEVLAKIMVSAI